VKGRTSKGERKGNFFIGDLSRGTPGNEESDP
jgi:hypothetical protein